MRRPHKTHVPAEHGFGVKAESRYQRQDSHYGRRQSARRGHRRYRRYYRLSPLPVPASALRLLSVALVREVTDTGVRHALDDVIAELDRAVALTPVSLKVLAKTYQQVLNPGPAVVDEWVLRA